MGTTLQEVADHADSVADDQRRVAREARRMQRRRDAGWSWARIIDTAPPPGLIELVRRSGQGLAKATATTMKFLAHELTSEGESRRQVGRRLGVSHQRVSALVASRKGRSRGQRGSK